MWMMWFWFPKAVSRWSARPTWSTYGSIPARCLMLRFIIRSRTRKSSTTARFIRPISSPKASTKHADGSSLYMRSLRWYSIACRIKPSFRTAWCWTRMATKCPNVWVMPSIRSPRLSSTVPILCAGTWLRMPLRGITSNLILTVSKKFAASSSVHYIILIRSSLCMRMWTVLIIPNRMWTGKNVPKSTVGFCRCWIRW